MALDNKVILILAAFGLPLLFSACDDVIYKHDQTVSMMSVIQEQVTHFKTDTGHYPKTEEGLNALLVATGGISSWKGPYLRRGVPNDSWVHAYIYYYPPRYGSREFDLYSRGKNGIDENGKGDDISNWGGYNKWIYDKERLLNRYIAILLVIIILGLTAVFVSKKRNNRRP